MAGKKRVVKKVKKKADAHCMVTVRATFNNTIICIADSNGDVVAWASGGKAGFKGSRKSMPYTATVAGEMVGKEAIDAGVKSIEVIIRGGGAGRESAVRALNAAGLTIKSIKDLTAIPHNGCRRPKKRRV